MKYLLIDFGASFIKVGIYDKDIKSYFKQFDEISPFTFSDKLNKLELYDILSNIISKFYNIDGIIICTIIGGGYVNDTYFSWKSDFAPKKSNCLISELFKNEKTFHIHNHHDYLSTIENIKILGKINNIPIYSSLGDTNCVIESIDLDNENIVINIGTGSQIFYKNDNNINIFKYFPAGRTLLTYQELFSSLNLNLFELLQNISLNDIIHSSLNIDIKVFKQAREYNNGGFISNINEGNFSYKNLLGSLLKSLVLQYKDFLPQRNKILLTGGIVKKLNVLKSAFIYYYPSYEINLINQDIESTHKGMIKYIDKYL